MKGLIGTSTSYEYLFSKTALYNGQMLKSIQFILAFNSSDIAQRRLKIIEFHNRYGTKITIDAFGISKATIYR